MSGLSTNNLNEENTSRFKYYSEEALSIASISSKLTANERLVRNYIMESIINCAAPVNIADLEQVFNSRLDSVLAIVDSLVDKRAVVRDELGNIVFAYPVSALPTAHQVNLQDGRQLYAMCAVDALGVAFTFKQDIKINSVCRHCNAPVALQIINGKIVDLHPATAHVMHVDLKKMDNWAGSC